ncbi:MAG TPA: ACT domain-containing protein [Candidatus Dormibacteraeota bacterium]|nr:ACT domain-containing protein [Candidatus Dormibacteraeota bacterium]
MTTAKEYTLTMDDRPGTLGKICRALSERNVNIVAAQSFPSSGKSTTRFVFDDPTKARSVLDSERVTYTETEVVNVSLAHRPGELARAARKLGDASININYLYCGVEPKTNAPLIIFGVADVGKAAPLLEQAAAAGRG